MAWAVGHELKTVLAKIKHHADNYDLVPLSSPAVSEPPDLESIDYQEWTKNKRHWFKRQFPWIFELQTALAKQGIQLDYPRLLIESGDIRQFAYPAASATRIPSLDPNSLLKTAGAYGFDKPWLVKKMRAARTAENAPTPKERLTGLTAFEKWAENINRAMSADREPAPDILLYSLHAATYLANTRSLLWFGVKSGRVAVGAKDKERVLALLRSQVRAANSLAGNMIQLLWTSYDRPCEGYWELSRNVTDNLTAIITAENEILEYDQTK
jgi:hypothetical protein